MSRFKASYVLLNKTPSYVPLAQAFFRGSLQVSLVKLLARLPPSFLVRLVMKLLGRLHEAITKVKQINLSQYGLILRSYYICKILCMICPSLYVAKRRKRKRKIHQSLLFHSYVLISVRNKVKNERNYC
jgi:hypothetical protein